ncbi:MAG: hypothetical protein ACO28V_09335 [Chitinophagaceae bacterium]
MIKENVNIQSELESGLKWEKPILLVLNIQMTNADDCTAKIGPGSPDGNTTCTYAGIATS